MKAQINPTPEEKIRTLREEVVDALVAAKKVRATIRRGPKTVRYTITFSVPREL